MILLEKIIKLKNASIDGFDTARKQGEKCVKYMVNNPYTGTEKADASTYGKPLLSYPLLQAKLNVLLGNEQLNRRIAKIVSAYDIDENMVRLLNDNYKAIIEQDDLERKLVKVLADALIYPTGGWIRRVLVLNDLGYLDFHYELLDTLLNVHPDPQFRQFDMMDAKYVVIEDWLTIDKIKDEFEPKSPTVEEEKWWLEVLATVNDLDERKEADNNYKRGDRYQVLQLEERKKVKVNIVKIPDVEGFVKLTDKELKKVKDYTFIKKSSDDRIFISTVVPYFKDLVLQDKPYPYPTKRFSVFPCFSFDYNLPKSEQTSAIYLLKDVQDRVNKGMNQQVDWVTQALNKNKYIPAYETDAINLMKRKGNQPNPTIPLTSMKNVPQQDKDPHIPPEILNDVLTNVNFVDSILGVTPAMEGRSERSGESGVLHEQKVLQSQVSTNPFFDNLAQTRELLAKDYVELVPYVYFEENRLIELSGEHGLTYEMVNLNIGGEIQNDLRVVSARAILDEGQNVPDRLQKSFEQNIAFANILIGAGANFQDLPLELIVKHSNIRDKDEWSAFLKQAQQVHAEQLAQEQASQQMAGLVQSAQAMQPQEQANKGE